MEEPWPPTECVEIGCENKPVYATDCGHSKPWWHCAECAVEVTPQMEEDPVLRWSYYRVPIEGLTRKRVMEIYTNCHLAKEEAQHHWIRWHYRDPRKKRLPKETQDHYYATDTELRCMQIRHKRRMRVKEIDRQIKAYLAELQELHGKLDADILACSTPLKRPSPPSCSARSSH